MNQDDPAQDPAREPDPASETQPLPPEDAPFEAPPDTDEGVPTEPEPERRRRPRIDARTEIPFGLIAFLLIAVLLVVFTVQNSSEDVTLSFLAWEGSYPLALIIIGVVAVTVILDEVMGLFLRQRRRKRLAEREELKRLREMNG